MPQPPCLRSAGRQGYWVYIDEIIQPELGCNLAEMSPVTSSSQHYPVVILHFYLACAHPRHVWNNGQHTSSIFPCICNELTIHKIFIHWINLHYYTSLWIREMYDCIKDTLKIHKWYLFRTFLASCYQMKRSFWFFEIMDRI